MTLDQLLAIYRSAKDVTPDGTSCYSITPRLVRGQSLSRQQEDMVAQLDAHIQKANPSAAEIFLYRGCAPEDLAGIPHKAYQSYMSASKTLAEALRFVDGCLVRIQCPTGTRYLSVSPQQHSIASLEHDEILLPRNCHYEIEEWDFWSTASDTDKLLVQTSNLKEFKTLTLKMNSDELSPSPYSSPAAGSESGEA